MTIWGQLSIKSRLIALLVGVNLVVLLTGGLLTLQQFQRAFQQEVVASLTSIRVSKAEQLETYLDDVQGHVATLSENQMVVDAMVKLNADYRDLQNQAIADDWIEAIEDYYTQQFVPTLAQRSSGTYIVANYRPVTQAGQYLQYHYTVRNNTASLATLDDANDGSQYSRTHSLYHQRLHHIITEFGYDDLYLINFDTGEVVYSAYKRPDFGTNLDRGPYRRSNLADVVNLVRNDPGRNFVKVVDYKPYVPNQLEPTAFVAAPIYNGPHIVGIIAVQLPKDRINTILTGNQAWAELGLGQTGQIYVVGDDLLMRSTARPLIEDRDSYLNTLKRLGQTPQTLTLIETLNTSILLQEVNTMATTAAFAGDIGTQLGRDYRGIPVLSSYAPLRVGGLDWAIVAEIDQSEAFRPVTLLQLYMSILGVILILLVTWFANFMALSLFRPIRKLLHVAHQIQSGQRDVDLNFGRDSKLGELGHALYGVLQEIQHQEALVAEKNIVNERLLNNMLPAPLVPRFIKGDPVIADAIPHATLIVVRITGLQALTQTHSSEKIVVLFDRLVRVFEEKAQYYGLETQLTIDETYIATCGIAQAFLDHQERTVNFALELVRISETGSEGFPAEIDLQIGIHSGPVVAGVVGSPTFMYKLWGRTVEVALALNPKGGASNSILVTKTIRDRLTGRYMLVPCPPLYLEKKDEPHPRWMVFTRTGQFIQQVDLVQKTHNLLLPQLTIATEILYNRISHLAPEIDAMLKGDDPLVHQALVRNTLQTLVNGLSSLDKLLPMVQAWGGVYAQAGVQDNHYEVVGDALVVMLEQTLGETFTLEVEEAWMAMYHLLSGVVREATTATSNSSPSGPPSAAPSQRAASPNISSPMTDTP
ncbi:MAG: adenylate/guanylate cyclase domain-containing protein [Leptolyngbyaceae bacterium]|nr:adenylate/guanylate cyclase domain-containing protein [Leptolyngbyaceae bacterium]